MFFDLSKGLPNNKHLGLEISPLKSSLSKFEIIEIIWQRTLDELVYIRNFEMLKNKTWTYLDTVCSILWSFALAEYQYDFCLELKRIIFRCFMQFFFNEFFWIYWHNAGHARNDFFAGRGKNYRSRDICVVRFCEEVGRTRKAFSWKARTRGAEKERIKDPSAFWASIIFSGIGFFVDGQSTINKCRFYGCQIGHLKYIRVLLVVGNASSTPWPFFDGSVSTSGATETRIPIRKKTIARIRIRSELSNLYIAFTVKCKNLFLINCLNLIFRWNVDWLFRFYWL